MNACARFLSPCVDAKFFLSIFRSSLHLCCTLNLCLPSKFEQKPTAFLKIPVHVVQTQTFLFSTAIIPSPTVQILGSKIIIKYIVIYCFVKNLLYSNILLIYYVFYCFSNEIAAICILQLHLHRVIVTFFHGCDLLIKVH